MLVLAKDMAWTMGIANCRMQKIGNMISASMLTSISASLRTFSSFLAAGVVLAARLKASFVDLPTAKSPDWGGVNRHSVPSVLATLAPDADTGSKGWRRVHRGDLLCGSFYRQLCNIPCSPSGIPNSFSCSSGPHAVANICTTVYS